jgi:hypothetical protein
MMYARYLFYGVLMLLGACTLGSSFSEDRSEWGTVFADANRCEGEACKKANNDNTGLVSRGKR